MIKVHKKISGTFRGLHGAAIFYCIRSGISSYKKQGLPIFECVKTAFQGEPFMPEPPKVPHCNDF
jgi:hypothetical protein